MSELSQLSPPGGGDVGGGVRVSSSTYAAFPYGVSGVAISQPPYLNTLGRKSRMCMYCCKVFTRSTTRRYHEAKCKMRGRGFDSVPTISPVTGLPLSTSSISPSSSLPMMPHLATPGLSFNNPAMNSLIDRGAPSPNGSCTSSISPVYYTPLSSSQNITSSSEINKMTISDINDNKLPLKKELKDETVSDGDDIDIDYEENDYHDHEKMLYSHLQQARAPTQLSPHADESGIRLNGAPPLLDIHEGFAALSSAMFAATSNPLLSSFYNAALSYGQPASLPPIPTLKSDINMNKAINLSAAGRSETFNLSEFCRCDICGKVLPSESQLALHKHSHDDIRPYPCRICGSRFTMLSSRRSHERTHLGEKPYWCIACTARFTRRYSLKLHEKRHIDGPFACRYCDVQCRTISDLKKHMECHSLVPEKIASINLSDDSKQGHSSESQDTNPNSPASSDDERDFTMSNIKDRSLSGSPEFPGQRRGKAFDMMLSDSKTSNSDTEENKNTDGQTMMVSSSLATTIIADPSTPPAIESSDLKPNTADLAMMAAMNTISTTTTTATDNDEMLNTSNGIQEDTLDAKLRCEQCGEEFAHAYLLKIHVKVHAAKPFACPVCGKRFGYRNNMKTHIKCHLGMKPHVCNRCGARFTRASTLRRHIEKHESLGDSILPGTRSYNLTSNGVASLNNNNNNVNNNYMPSGMLPPQLKFLNNTGAMTTNGQAQLFSTVTHPIVHHGNSTSILATSLPAVSSSSIEFQRQLWLKQNERKLANDIRETVSYNPVASLANFSSSIGQSFSSNYSDPTSTHPSSGSPILIGSSHFSPTLPASLHMAAALPSGKNDLVMPSLQASAHLQASLLPRVRGNGHLLPVSNHLLNTTLADSSPVLGAAPMMRNGSSMQMATPLPSMAAVLSILPPKLARNNGIGNMSTHNSTSSTQPHSQRSQSLPVTTSTLPQQSQALNLSVPATSSVVRDQRRHCDDNNESDDDDHSPNLEPISDDDERGGGGSSDSDAPVDDHSDTSGSRNLPITNSQNFDRNMNIERESKVKGEKKSGQMSSAYVVSDSEASAISPLVTMSRDHEKTKISSPTQSRGLHDVEVQVQTCSCFDSPRPFLSPGLLRAQLYSETLEEPSTSLNISGTMSPPSGHDLELTPTTDTDSDHLSTVRSLSELVSGGQLFVCEHCDCYFREYTMLKIHKRMHVGSRDSPFVCALCREDCHDKVYFSLHIYEHLK